MDEKFVEKIDFTLVRSGSPPETDLTLVQVAAISEEASPDNHNDKSFPVEYTLDPIDHSPHSLDPIRPNFEVLRRQS